MLRAACSAEQVRVAAGDHRPHISGSVSRVRRASELSSLLQTNPASNIFTMMVQRPGSSPSTKANRVCGVTPGRCRWSAGFLGGLQFPPSFHSGAAPFSPRFILVGCQDPDVKSRPNLLPLLHFHHPCELSAIGYSRGGRWLREQGRGCALSWRDERLLSAVYLDEGDARLLGRRRVRHQLQFFPITFLPPRGCSTQETLITFLPPRGRNGKQCPQSAITVTEEISERETVMGRVAELAAQPYKGWHVIVIGSLRLPLADRIAGPSPSALWRPSTGILGNVRAWAELFHQQPLQKTATTKNQTFVVSLRWLRYLYANLRIANSSYLDHGLCWLNTRVKWLTRATEGGGGALLVEKWMCDCPTVLCVYALFSLHGRGGIALRRGWGGGEWCTARAAFNSSSQGGVKVGGVRRRCSVMGRRLSSHGCRARDVPPRATCGSPLTSRLSPGPHLHPPPPTSLYQDCEGTRVN
ncbi:hypothetical protein PR048_021812 [Dryococelus australis]|uniref:Uncharacterized protein n=1 Tax=Dryococelus australis TaxID=614101 RepID=A0ABQ9GZG0_9NEOP|nr:hypothetical protein PR048_021812 [Dryococelus australis]